MATSVGVAMKFSNDTTGKSWTKTLSKLDPNGITDTDDAKLFAQKYAGIVDGTLTGADFIETTTVVVE